MSAGPVRFHVIYTPGTVAALLPFAVSLLAEPEADYTLVDNACAEPESARLRALAAAERRLSYERLPFDRPVRHGIALDHLLESAGAASPRFAVLDSDIFASGPFVSPLRAELDRGAGAVATGWPVWLADGEARCAADQPSLAGPFRELADGTPVGGTSCALYRREALDRALAATGLGLADRDRVEVPAELLARIEPQPHRFQRFGTARLAHLQLIAQGEPPANVDSDALHHLGGLSHIGETGRAQAARGMLSGPRSPLLNLAGNARRRLARSGRERSAIYLRKGRIVGALHDALEALAEAREPRPPGATGSAEVDRRVGLLWGALLEGYPGWRARVAEAVATEGARVRGADAR